MWANTMNHEVLTTTVERLPVKLNPELNPYLRITRERDGAIKLFYAYMRSLREAGEQILDIGAGIEVDELESKEIIPIINGVHDESNRQGHQLYKEYASSWGTMELRQALAGYFTSRGVEALDPRCDVMVTHGIMDAYDKVLQALDVSWVVVPSWTPYYARSHALMNGKTILEVPLDPETGNLNLSTLSGSLREVGANPGKTLMYVCQPSSPLGTLMPDEFIEHELRPFLQDAGIWLFNDYYVSTTRYDGGDIIRPLLSYPGMKELTVEAITVSKEHGIPGIRVGGIVGQPDIINAIRLLAAAKIDIVPGISQLMAARALNEMDVSLVAHRVTREVHEEVLPRLRNMHWPMIEPKAGLDMVVAVPPRFIRDDIDDPSLLAAFTILRRYGVALCPCTVYGPDGKYYLRIVLKQRAGKVPRGLDLLQKNGFNWETETPTEEDEAYLHTLLSQLDLTRL